MANFKTASVMVMAVHPGTQSLIDGGSGTRLRWYETADLTNYGQGATNFANNKFTAPYSGFYQVSVSLFFGYGVTLSAGYISVVLNGNLASGIVLTNGAVPTGAVQNVSRIFRLAKGETIEIYAAQTSGANQTPDTVNTTLSIVRVGNAS
jgi:hypothetical protein